jgi:hypothetical protein
VVVLFGSDLGFEPEATNVGNDSEAQMKNLLRVVALFVVVVLVASGCSYSEEAEPGVRNFTVKKISVGDLPHLTDDCEYGPSYEDKRTYDSVPWECLNESEQRRAAGLLHTVRWLVRWDETVSYIGPPVEDGTRLLKLLIDFEILEVLCYTGVMQSMRETPAWPLITDTYLEDGYGFAAGLQNNLEKIRYKLIDDHLSRGTGARMADEEIPVVEAVRYQHLCPSWILGP